MKKQHVALNEKTRKRNGCQVFFAFEVAPK